MDRAARKKRDVLERMLLDESVEPTDLPLSLLEYLTNNFSDEKQIGRGGFAVVYKGTLRNGTVAVKKLEFNTHLHENKFKEEVECLMKAKHKNVVRFLGYCADTQGMMERYNGKVVLAEVPQRLLCFEYLPKGSLHDYITDASRELEWTQCYQIIKGICAGLHYLHENCIVHLDLKPANILFDDNVVPKIADFGLSRCFEEMQSHVITSKLYGTLGYIAPEVIYCGRITFMSDMYSLGVIIYEILSGKKMYLEDYDVLKSWGNRLDKLYREKQLEQLRVCAKIAKECTDYDPKKRPDAQAIVRRLDEVDIIVDRYIIAHRPDEADIVNRSIVSDMSNLSVAQEEINKVEKPGDGSKLFGAIGRELSHRRGSASVSVSPRTHKPQYHTIGVSFPLVLSNDPAAPVTRSVRVLGSTTKRSSTTAHSVKGFRMRKSCNGLRVLGLTTKRSSSVKGFRMQMSCCNGCRVLRKGCSDNCAIRECLQWIRSPDAQANATVFLAKFYGRAGLLNFIIAGPEHIRPAIFRSLLYEACGRIVNPVYGSVGLLWSGNWQLCQAAVESVLQGMPIVQLPPAAMAIGSGIHL